MVTRAVSKLTAPLRRRVMLMIRMGVLKLVGATSKTQELQVAVFDGETLARVKHLLPYGFNVHPRVGSEVVLIFPAGNTSNPIAISVGGRAHRPTDLAVGEVEIYDDQGQRVTLRRNGIVLQTPFKVTCTAPEGVRFETPQLECTGEIIDMVDAGGRTMSGMRQVFNGHVHPENDGGGPTDAPTEGM